MALQRNSASFDRHLPDDGSRRLAGASRAETVAVWSLIVYFAAKICFFAVTIRTHVFPDEDSWFGMVKVFSQSFLLPVDSPASYPFGLITHIPWLYFFLMGKVLIGNILPISDLIFLRLVNGLVSVVTVFYGWRLATILKLPMAVRGLFMVMVTNTVMFTFISAAVSYDNLSNLFAVLSLYYLVRFFLERGVPFFLLSCLFAMTGTLTKNVMLPYCLALLLVLLAREWRRLPSAIKGFPTFVMSLRGRNAVLALLCAGSLSANLVLYGGNLMRFGTLLPAMDQVLPLEACLQNRIFARDYVVREFQSGRLSLLDAQRIALQIRNPGDRASAVTRLAEAARSRQGGAAPRMGRFRYALEWLEIVVSRTYSVAAHLSLFKYSRDFYPYYAVFLAAGVLWVVRFRRLLEPGMGGVMFVALFYSLILMQGVNYTIYRNSGFSGVALTGRYMFPVLIPVYLLTAQGLIGKMPRWWQAVAGGGAVLLFIIGEFPWFIRNAGAEWYF